MPDALGDKGENQGVEADPFLSGHGDESGVKGFGQAGNEFTGGFYQFH